MSSTKQLTFSHGLTSDARKRLLEHFSGDGPSVNDRWAALWDAGDFLPWDRGCPNPALVDLLEQQKDLLGNSIFIQNPETGEKRRKRALVPGCGRGYDVLLLASFGYDAYGLEVSTKAVELCNEFSEAFKSDYPVRDEKVGAGEARFVAGDFFEDDWLSQVEGGQSFELCYDYTFLCALHPSKRPLWSLRYVQLMSPHPESRLICVEFPTYKEASTGGPPFGVPPAVYVAHLGHPGLEQSYDADSNLIGECTDSTDVSRFQRIAHWQPPRTHEVGKGTDYVSVWKVI